MLRLLYAHEYDAGAALLTLALLLALLVVLRPGRISSAKSPAESTLRAKRLASLCCPLSRWRQRGRRR
jgi:hypothetical protein